MLQLVLGFCLSAVTADAAYPQPTLLMEPTELAKPGVLDKCLVLDARDRKKYDAGHIAGAIWVDHAAWAKAFQENKDAAAWAERLAAVGVSGQRPVVIYDDDRSKSAARIWWLLHYWDIPDARLLNGGWLAWQAANLPTSMVAGVPEKVKLKLAPRGERLATKDQVRQTLDSKASQIVDARSEGEFCGDQKMAKRGGAIPGAKHLEWSDLLDAKTHRFKSAAELRRLFTEANIDPTKPVITYCQSGGRAAVMAFALELMGSKDVRNYYGSWAEWGNADETPIEPGKRRQ